MAKVRGEKLRVLNGGRHSWGRNWVSKRESVFVVTENTSGKPTKILTMSTKVSGIKGRTDVMPTKGGNEKTLQIKGT